MAVLPASVPCIFLVVIWLSFHPVSNTLTYLSTSDILKDVKNHCVVVLLSAKDETLRDYLDDIRISLENSPASGAREGIAGMPGDPPHDYIERPLLSHGQSHSIKIGEIEGEFRWTETKHVDITKSEPTGHFQQPSVVVFAPIPKDRSCLLSAPTDTNYPKAEAYTGPYTKALLLEFINTKCNTYLDLNGRLSTEGHHRQHILANLYSVHTVPSITMLDAYRLQKLTNLKPRSNWKFNNSRILPEKVDAHAENGMDLVGEKESDVCLSERNGGKGDFASASLKCLDSSCVDDSADAPVDQPSHLHSGQSKMASRLSGGDIPRCERVSHLTREEFFSDYLKRSRPVILANGAAGWPAVSKWTMDYLEQEFGDQRVHIKLAPDGVFEGVEPVSIWDGYEDFTIPEEVQSKLPFPDLVVVRPATQNVKFSEFLQMIRNSSHQAEKPGKGFRPSMHARVSAYLEYSSIPTYFPKLEEDVVEPDVAHHLLTRRHLNIWLSDGDTLGKLHFDPFDNFLCQLKGRKELMLFEPHNNEQMYEAHIPEALLGFDARTRRFRRKKLMDSTSMVMSPVDITKPDFERFPEFAHARPLNCTIDEGDILFMPAFWWHEVQSYPNQEERRNLAVNYWYEPFLHKEFPCVHCKLDVNTFYRHLL